MVQTFQLIFLSWLQLFERPWPNFSASVNRDYVLVKQLNLQENTTISTDHLLIHKVEFTHRYSYFNAENILHIYKLFCKISVHHFYLNLTLKHKTIKQQLDVGV